MYIHNIYLYLLYYYKSNDLYLSLLCKYIYRESKTNPLRAQRLLVEKMGKFSSVCE